MKTLWIILIILTAINVLNKMIVHGLISDDNYIFYYSNKDYKIKVDNIRILYGIYNILVYLYGIIVLIIQIINI